MKKRFHSLVLVLRFGVAKMTTSIAAALFIITAIEAKRIAVAVTVSNGTSDDGRACDVVIVRICDGDG